MVSIVKSLVDVVGNSDDDDDEGFVLSFCILKDAMLSLPMACYFHRLKSVVLFDTKNNNGRKFREEEPDFDPLRLCSPD